VSTPNTAGPSSHVSISPRSCIPGSLTALQAFRPTAPRIASRPSVPPAQSSPAPFDLSSLRQHLSPPPAPLQSVARAPVQAGGWAGSFIPAETSRAASSAGQRAQSPHHAGPSPWQADFRNHVDSARSSPALPSLRQASSAPWQRPVHLPQYAPSPYQHYQQLPFVPGPAYHHSPPLPSIYSPQPNHPVQVGRPTSAPQETSTREESHHQEPLSQPQDLLARTAESLVNGVVADEHLAQNPKLAESKFMALMQAVAKGKVVVDEGEPSASEEVGEGARFVERSAGATGWTGDFLGHPSEATSTQAARAHEPAVSHVFDRAGPSAWATQFGDQEALVMRDARPTTQRRKSVHFDPVSEPASLGSGVPANLDEALSHTTAVPGAGTSWQEQGLDDDDFGEEAFMNFNGPMRVVREGRIGVGALEGWGALQNDWEVFSRGESGRQGLRGQEMGDRVERYLFQRANPYAQSGVRDDEMTGRESPTLKVCRLFADPRGQPMNCC
jgi:peroxin-5